MHDLYAVSEAAKKKLANQKCIGREEVNEREVQPEAMLMNLRSKDIEHVQVFTLYFVIN